MLAGTAAAVAVGATVFLTFGWGSKYSGRPPWPAPSASVAAATRSYLASTPSLLPFHRAASGLVSKHDPASCGQTRTAVSRLGTPLELRLSANDVPDPVAADLLADEVTAVGDLLGGCQTPSSSGGTAGVGEVQMASRLVAERLTQMKVQL